MTAVAALGAESRFPQRKANVLVAAMRLQQAPMIIALVVVVVFFQLATGFFLRPQNISNLLVETVPLALIAIASAIMILMGEIDLSLGSVAGFTAALGVASMAHLGWSWEAGLLVFVVSGIAAGALQGLIVVVGRIRSFVLTLAGYLVFYGVQLALLGPSSRIPMPTSPLSNLAFAKLPLWAALTVVALLAAILAYQAVSRWRHRAERPSRLALRLLVPVAALVAGVCAALYVEESGGFPLQFAILVILILVFSFVLSRTVGGRHLYAVGGNPRAARENGIRTGLVRWTGFLVAGGLAGLAGLALATYTSGADSTTGTGSLLLSGIGAAVIGGISLLGGRGSVWGAFCGAILLAAVQNGLNLMALANYLIYIVQGLVVLGALLLDANIRRKLVTQ